MHGTANARLRQLPDGEWLTGLRYEIAGRVLKVEFDAPHSFPLGAPVEIDCGEKLYLGELQSRDSLIFYIRVEHQLDQKRASWLRSVWTQSESH